MHDLQTIIKINRPLNQRTPEAVAKAYQIAFHTGRKDWLGFPVAEKGTDDLVTALPEKAHWVRED